MTAPTTSTDKIGLHFGALCKPIATQVVAQGLTISRDDAKAVQADADAITRLLIRGLLTDAAAHAARKKLVKRLGRIVTHAPR